MRIGINVAHCGALARPTAVTAAARAADQLGYSSVWVCDEGLDPTGVLAATAAVTSRVRVGASVAVAGDDDPARLVRSWATVHLLSEGRLSIAMGPAAGSSGDRLDDVLDAIDARWPDGGRPVVLLDGEGPGGLDRVARRAGGWAPAGLAPDELGPPWAGVRDLAARHGRDPDRLELVVRARIVLTPGPLDGTRSSFAGDADQIGDDLDVARRAGASEVVLRLLGDLTLDEALDGYARVAEAVELRARAARRA